MSKPRTHTDTTYWQKTRYILRRYRAILTRPFLEQSKRTVLSHNMAEATAADGQMKNLSISEVKKNKKDGAPKTAAKKPQQQKKKVR